MLQKYKKKRMLNDDKLVRERERKRVGNFENIYTFIVVVYSASIGYLILLGKIFRPFYWKQTNFGNE